MSRWEPMDWAWRVRWIEGVNKLPPLVASEGISENHAFTIQELTSFNQTENEV